MAEKELPPPPASNLIVPFPPGLFSSSTHSRYFINAHVSRKGRKGGWREELCEGGLRGGGAVVRM